MPVTADALDVANIYNPEENINAGTRHFRWLLDRFDGDVQLHWPLTMPGSKTCCATTAFRPILKPVPTLPGC